MSDAQRMGERLSLSRHSVNMSLAAAAQRLGVRRDTLARWERGESEPRAHKLRQIAGVYGAPLTWLLAGEDAAAGPGAPLIGDKAPATPGGPLAGEEGAAAPGAPVEADNSAGAELRRKLDEIEALSRRLSALSAELRVALQRQSIETKD